MTEIKAIPTRYKGYHFRSRLEARWAVFFDALGIKWEYEKEGYETPHGYYLPDFYIITDPKDNVGWLCEVKPSHKILTDREKNVFVHIDSHPPKEALGALWLIGMPEKIPYSPKINPENLTHHEIMSESDIKEINAYFDWQCLHQNYLFARMSNGIKYDDRDFWNECCDSARSARFEHGENGAT